MSERMPEPPSEDKIVPEFSAPEFKVDPTPWQIEFKAQLAALEDRIRGHLVAADRLADKVGDMEGMNQDVAHERALEEEALQRQAAETLKLERVDLIEGVPTEHYHESLVVREELGPTLDH